MSTDGMPGGEELEVVVLDRRRLVEELAALQASCGAPDRIGQPRRGVLFAPDAELAIADHVDQDEGADVLDGAGLRRSST